LQLRFLGDKQNKREHSRELIAAGRELVALIKFDRKSQRDDFALQYIIEVSLPNEDGYDFVKSICVNLAAAIESSEIYGFECANLLGSIIRAQPVVALDSFFTGSVNAVRSGSELMRQCSDHGPNPMDVIDDGVLLEWCMRDPTTRFPAVATAVTPFSDSADHMPLRWTPLSSALVHNAPDPIAVMRPFVVRFRPTFSNGSRATLLESGARLLEHFEPQGNAQLAMFIASEEARLLREAATAREWETRQDKERDERFE
jgi:hypothetical protein